MYTQQQAMQWSHFMQDRTNWKTAKPKHWNGWLCKPELGTDVKCPFTGKMITTTQEEPFILSDTRGSLSKASAQYIGAMFTLPDNQRITGAYLKSKCDRDGNLDWLSIRFNPDALTADGRSFKAIQCPAIFNDIDGIAQGTINPSYIAQHGKGDFLVVAVDTATDRVYGKPQVVNGLIFGDIYDNHGWTDHLVSQPITNPTIPVFTKKGKGIAALEQLATMLCENARIPEVFDDISQGQKMFMSTVVENGVSTQKAEPGWVILLKKTVTPTGGLPHKALVCSISLRMNNGEPEVCWTRRGLLKGGAPGDCLNRDCRSKRVLISELCKMPASQLKPEHATRFIQAVLSLPLARFKPKAYKPTRKRTDYTIHCCKMPAGQTFYNQLEDVTYHTTDEVCIVLKGTRGEQWTIRPEKLINTYVRVDGQPLTLDSLTSDWVAIKPKEGTSATNYAVLVPVHQQFEVEAWGSVLKGNRPGVPHGKGDMLVCGCDEHGNPKTDSAWIVNGEVFKDTYDTSNFPEVF